MDAAGQGGFQAGELRLGEWETRRRGGGHGGPSVRFAGGVIEQVALPVEDVGGVFVPVVGEQDEGGAAGDE